MALICDLNVTQERLPAGGRSSSGQSFSGIICGFQDYSPGSTYSANGCVEFMKECLAKLPKRIWKIAVRADSALFNGALYLVKVKTKGLIALLETQSWQKVKNKPRVEKTEFTYKCSGWKRARRFVAIRQVKEYESDGVLFNTPKIEYQYFCYVTNISLTPWSAHKYFGNRANTIFVIRFCDIYKI